MVKATLSVKYGLKRHNKCCKDYVLPSSVLNLIGTMTEHSGDKVNETENVVEICGDIFWNEEEAIIIKLSISKFFGCFLSPFF